MIILSQEQIVKRKKLKLYEVKWDEEHKEYVPTNTGLHKGRINDNTLMLCRGMAWDSSINDFFPYFCIKNNEKYYLFDVDWENWNLFHGFVVENGGNFYEAAKLIEAYEDL